MADNVLPFETRDLELGLRPEPAELGRNCRHGHPQADSQKRVVWCRDCRERLDPFEVLLAYARREVRERRELKASRRLGIACHWFAAQGGSISIGRSGVRVSAKDPSGKRISRQVAVGPRGIGSLPEAILEAIERIAWPLGKFREWQEAIGDRKT